MVAQVCEPAEPVYKELSPPHSVYELATPAGGQAYAIISSAGGPPNVEIDEDALG